MIQYAQTHPASFDFGQVSSYGVALFALCFTFYTLAGMMRLTSTSEEEIKRELDRMLKAEWIEHYDYVVEVLGEKGYSKETVRKVLDEEIARLG